MAQPKLTAEQIAQISTLVAEYITTQRERFSTEAASLAASQKATMASFFPPPALDSVRLRVLQGLRVENPAFYPVLARMGLSNLPDISRMAAITFADVIVSHEFFTDGLLFHELVHVEQYRQLGIPRFSELYVRGFLSGGRYEGIPLEANAYDLTRRFEENPRQPFSAAAEVAKWVREARF